MNNEKKYMKNKIEEKMENNDLAPIILFVYNRLEHTKNTIEALKKNKLSEQSQLYIYSDGAKDENETTKVKEVRKYIHQITGFKKINIIERNKNYGLSQSVICGVDEVIFEHGKAIVLEDDLVTTADFLTYMNNALEQYKTSSKVYGISGYSFLNPKYQSKILTAYFLPFTSSWAWATWSSKWEKLDLDAKGWERLRWDIFLRRKFNYYNSYNFYRLIKMQMLKKNIDSWAIRWYWSIFREKGLILYPSCSKATNRGFDGSGTHCGKVLVSDNSREELNICLPNKIDESRVARKYVIKSLKQQNSYIMKTINKLYPR